MNQATETKRASAISAEVIRTESGRAIGLNLTFANGRAIMVREGDLTLDMKAEATWHGIKQKYVDAAAISRNPDTGRSATIAEKYEAVLAVHTRVAEQGEWNAPREGNGGQSLLLAAMAEFSGKPVETVKTWLEGKSDAEKKALSLNPKVAAIINRIRAERAKADGIDSDSLLNELA